MEFFNLIASKMQDGQQLNLTIRKNGERLVLSMIPDTSGVKDNAVSNMKPLTLNGTPQEFEEKFDKAFVPMEKAFSLISEVQDYEKGLEETRKKTKMESKKKKEENDQKQKFLDHLNLAKKLLNEQKFKDAKTVLAKAEALPSADKKACEELKKKIEEKSGDGGLFGGVEDKSDGKELSPASCKTSDTAPEKSDEDQEQEPKQEEE